mgnify:FL=1
MNKKIITILTGIIVLVGAFFFYQHSGKNDLKAEHTKYLALINDNHDFDGGLKRLETLDNDEGQEIFKNIKTEIKIAKELKNIDTSLDNKDIDAAKKSLEKVDTLTVDNTFDKAIEWLKEDITNFDKAKKEIDEDKSGNISSIIDKYKFNHSALKAKLSEKDNSTDKDTKSNSNNLENKNPNTTKKEESTIPASERLAKNYEYYESTIKNDLISKSKSPDGQEAPTDGIDVSYRTFDKNNNLIMLNYTARDPQYSSIVLFKLNNDGTCSVVEYGPSQRTLATYKAVY